jgi:hypothetical protein
VLKVTVLPPVLFAVDVVAWHWLARSRVAVAALLTLASARLQRDAQRMASDVLPERGSVYCWTLFPGEGWVDFSLWFCISIRFWRLLYS